MASLCVAGEPCRRRQRVVYFAASLPAPTFAFDRSGSLGRRIWPASLTRAALDPWYDRVEEALPVTRTDWPDVSYAGGVLAAARHRAGHTCNLVPVAVDTSRLTNCNRMLSGCRFDAKRSMLLNYLPGAEAYGAVVRPLHEVQFLAPSTQSGYRYASPMPRPSIPEGLQLSADGVRRHPRQGRRAGCRSRGYTPRHPPAIRRTPGWCAGCGRPLLHRQR